MGYSLEDFCRESREILREHDDHQGRDQVRENLERLIADPGFQTDYLKTDDDSGLQQIYEDKDTGFCLLIYNMKEARKSPPHDHGASWAIYGQASGYTDMTEWRRVSDDPDDMRVEEVRTFRLTPGHAGLYDVGDIHSIDYPVNAKFVRVTGTDMKQIPRLVFDATTGTADSIQHVGTGEA